MSEILPNMHHVELFYHVARHGGITPASRAMPYGIQQPAISGQISRLEKELGAPLFIRRPFQLTPQGEELYAFIAPFFSALPGLMARVAGLADQRLRLAAPATAMRDHLPVALETLRNQFRGLELELTEATFAECCTLLDAGGIDLAIAEIPARIPPGIQTELLAHLDLALVIPGRASRSVTLEKLIERWRLIRPPINRLLSQLFSQTLKARHLEWPAAIEAGSLEAVNAFAERKFGVGLTVVTPAMKPPAGTWFWRLHDFPKLSVGGMWRNRLNAPADLLLNTLRNRVKVWDGS